MFCKNCGKQISDDSKFCQHCGHAVVFHGQNIVERSAVDAANPPKPQKVKKKSIFDRWWFWAIIVAFFFFYCVGAYEPNEENTVPTEITEVEYKSMCKEIDFDQLARNPDSYEGQMFRFTGEVIQVVEGSKTTELRMDVTAVNEGTDRVYYEDTIYVTIPKEEGSDSILDEDIITVYGICTGAESYLSIFGQKITLPGIDAKYYELIQ